MNIRKITTSAIMAAVGFILHQIMPGIPFLGGMKMDFLLLMMFFAIFMMEDIKEVLAVCLLFGILSAITTTFPGGQIANIVDKLITGPAVFYFGKLLRQILPKAATPILIFIGTLLSGAVFLYTGITVSGAALPFLKIYIGVVAPTSIINTLGGVLIEKVIERAGLQKALNIG